MTAHALVLSRSYDPTKSGRCLDRHDINLSNASADISSNSNSSSGDETPKEDKPPSARINVKGWRQPLLVFSVLFGMFLGFLDTTIVAVALPSIAGDFDEFSLSTWVVTAYLLTYMGECTSLHVTSRAHADCCLAFAIIISRMSDIFGRKVVEIASFVLFMVTSLGCGLSQSMIGL